MAIRDEDRATVGRGLIARIVAVAGGVFALMILFVLGGKIVENVDASEIVLIQSLGGSLNWHTQPGWIWQGFGKVTRYQKRGLIRFQPPARESASDERLPIVFNDAGKGVVKGSINYELPTNAKQLTEMHSFYPDQESLEAGLVRPALNKSVYLTGTMMTSYESYKEKRSMLIQLVEDQTQNGVYRTRTIEREIEEETLGPDGQPTKTKKQVTEVEIERKDGQPVRAETGQLARFGVRAFNFAIESIDYDATVTDQIKQQQGITMAVQTSIANAKKAIQDAVTAEAQGRANVAATRAAQEIEKTKAVVAAEQARDVAVLRAQEAEAYKRERILRADADAEYRRRIMSADNALEQRLEAYKYGVDRMATAIAQHQGAWVPNVMIGGQGANAQFSAVQGLIDLALVNQAKQLGLDLTPRVTATAPQAQPVTTTTADAVAAPPVSARRR
ncbi:MAG TPA: hypothetical protein VFV95_02735 [Vicinamibacterales bacterium]|nr:hypothetical protein [Vicinamibacterales bacterium]